MLILIPFHLCQLKDVWLVKLLRCQSSEIMTDTALNHFFANNHFKIGVKTLYI